MTHYKTKHILALTAIGLWALCGRVEAGEVEEKAAEAALVSEVFPSLTSGALSKAKLVDLPKGVLLRAGELAIKVGAVDAETKNAPEEMHKQLEKNRFFLLEQIATGKLLLQAAKKAGKVRKGVSDRDAIQAYFEDLTGKIEVSDDEVKAFYEENKAMCGGATLEQIQGQLKQYILQQKKQELVQEHIRTLGKRMTIRVDRAWTEAQVKLAMDNPVDKARASGKPSMVDFGAHGCGPCDMMTPILEDMKKKYAGKANVLFVHVREEQILGARYGIRSIPVQVFFDRNGKEVFRHTGYFPQEECEKWLKKAGGE